MPFDPSSEPEELPDWLKPPDDGSAGPGGQAAPDEQPEEQLPDWLTGEMPGSDKEEEEETPDWPTGEEPETGDEGESPDWLEAIRRRAAEDRQLSDPTPNGDTGEEPIEPEWLNQIRQRQQEEAVAEEPALPAEDQTRDISDEPDLDLPQDEEAQDWDWLTKTPEEGEDELPASEPEFEMDWVTDDLSSEWKEQEGAPADAGFEEPEDLPTIEEPVDEEPVEPIGEELTAEEPESEGPAVVGPAGGESPSWLDDILDAGSQHDEIEDSNWLEDLQTEAESLPHASAFSTNGLQWASSMEEEQEKENKAGDENIPDEYEENIFGDPDWLKGVRKDNASLPPLTHAPGSDSFISGLEDEEIDLDSIELPEWLEDESQDEITSPTPLDEAAEEEPDINLAPADLPDWLEALRPSKGAKTEPAEEAVHEKIEEKAKYSSPLDGLEEVLPPSIPIISPETSTAPIAEGLRVTPTQRAHVSVLQEMVADEGRIAPAERRVIPLTQRIQRWVIALVLLLGASVPLLLGIHIVPTPSLTPSALSAYQTIEALPSGAPVLVAVEYQPAYSGEMQAIATALLEHMLTKGMQPVFISTQPTGPGLTERLVKSNLNQHAYIAQNSYPNLGYLSGDTAALLNFATDPRGSLPLPLAGGASRWDQPPLDTIHTIGDFAAVLVLTDDPDTARSWVEQVQPNMASTGRPLIMAASAQAAPLIDPYTQTTPPQGAGLVSGLSGAVSYDAARGGQFSYQYWDAFTWGMNATVLLALFGGLYNLGRAWMERRG